MPRHHPQETLGHVITQREFPRDPKMGVLEDSLETLSEGLPVT